MSESQGFPPPSPDYSGKAAQDELRWQRDLLSQVAHAAITEQRRARRWNMLFRFALLAYLVLVLVIYLPRDWIAGVMDGSEESERHTALVELNGVISDDSLASADRIVGGLRAAFEDEETAAVILRINSPGGSAVQAGYISDEIIRLRKKHPETELYAVISDVAASGGYYVAAVADQIYADKASLVGSIGVIMNGFGFVDAMERVGVERRLLAAGEHKGFLDPFSPLRGDEASHMRGLLGDVHQQFIDVVRAGRGDRLGDDPDLFSGLLWSGEKALELGLVDALGSSSFVAREVVGEDRIVNFTVSRSLLERVAERMGASSGRAIATSVGGWRSGIQ